MSDEYFSLAYDERAQELADEIDEAQKRADAELAQLRATRSPRVRVGEALWHAKEQARADRARAELLKLAAGDT
jgi:hypothetical protein